MSEIFTPVPRDRWGRPMVQSPDGGKLISYTRCTTFVNVLEDRYNLERWQQRMVALGLSEREDLILAIAAHRDDKNKLNDICAAATEYAKSSAPATTGTALHALTDQFDRNDLDISRVPTAYRPDLLAYKKEIDSKGLEVEAIECFGINDDLRVGGTCDRIYKFKGRSYIGDTKTGSIEYNSSTIAMQLAVYANSVNYDPSSRMRSPREVDLNRAIVVHLPAGQGKCETKWIDIRRGWLGVQLAAAVRTWRNNKDFLEPLIDHDRWLAKVSECSTVDALNSLYFEAVSEGAWSDEMLSACMKRKEELREV